MTDRVGGVPDGSEPYGYRDMRTTQRNAVTLTGNDLGQPMMFAHGYGCDQNMWRLVAPAFADTYRLVLFDHVGNGKSDLSAYEDARYSTLDGYADDILQILHENDLWRVVFVGHSVSAMIGMLAGIQAPERIAAHVMIGPSPCYINDGDYVGGFSRADIDSLLETMESNYLGWSSNMAPAIMGAPEQPELAAELTNSFCRTDPEIAKQFAKATFLSDNRQDVAKLQTPTLVIQSSDDLIAPLAVGDYMQRTLPNGTLRVVTNTGHCPHLSAPGASCDAMEDFLDALGRPQGR